MNILGNIFLMYILDWSGFKNLKTIGADREVWNSTIPIITPEINNFIDDIASINIILLQLEWLLVVDQIGIR